MSTEITATKRSVGPDPVGLATMTAHEARECVSMIRGCLDQARDMILDLHDRKGWRALGYASWKDCVGGEFGQCRETLYKQLDAAKVAKEMEASVENFHTSEIPDSHLRALKAVPNERRVEAYREAVAESGGKPTAVAVKEVVDRKLATAVEVAAEPVGAGWSEPAPFRDLAEMRVAFLAHLAVQEEWAATLSRPDNNSRSREARAIKARLEDSARSMDERLPAWGDAWGATGYTITVDGVTYARGAYGELWDKAMSFDLDAIDAAPVADDNDDVPVQCGISRWYFTQIERFAKRISVTPEEYIRQAIVMRLDNDKSIFGPEDAMNAGRPEPKPKRVMKTLDLSPSSEQYLAYARGERRTSAVVEAVAGVFHCNNKVAMELLAGRLDVVDVPGGKFKIVEAEKVAV